MKLHFSKGNAKLDKLSERIGRQVWLFSLLSGHNCPYAKECLAKVKINETGKKYIEDGPDTKFRCYSASQEVLYPALFNIRQKQQAFVELATKNVSKATELLLSQLPNGVIRIHEGGDFPNKNYFKVWVNVARECKRQTFYAYTKSLPFWVSMRDELPTNFLLTASYGGWRDDMISEHALRYSRVVLSVEEAKAWNLPIDHDDYWAATPRFRNKNFCHLIHGPQPAKTPAAAAWQQLKINGNAGYSRKSKLVGVI